MEPPATLTARDVKDAKLQVLRNLDPLAGDAALRRVVRAQYTAGEIGGATARGYRECRSVSGRSDTRHQTTLQLGQ